MDNSKISKKIFTWIGGILLIFVLIVIIAFFAVWHNEISTVNSMKILVERNDSHEDGAVYLMHVKGDYYFEDFLKNGGAKNDKELLSYITSKITRGLIKMEIKESNIGCSSFTVATKSGERIFGRNYDMTKTNTCIVFTKGNKKRHSTISTVDLQYLGMDAEKNVEGLMNKITCLAAPYAPLDGINDAGVACGIYMTYQGNEKTVATNQNTSKADITSTTMLRAILDYADDIDEAVKIAEEYDLHDSANTSFHYMVADKSGKSAILEWVGENDLSDNDGSKRHLVIHFNDKDEYIGSKEASSDYQVVTNFVLNPGYYDKVPEENKKGFDRYEKMYEILDSKNGIVEDEKDAMNILNAVSRRDWVQQGDNNSITVHSVVYNLTEKTALWIPNEHYDDEKYNFCFGF